MRRHLPLRQPVIQLSLLNDNEGLTHFTQLAWHHAPLTWSCLWCTVQKLTSQTTKGHKSDMYNFDSVTWRPEMGETRELEKEMGTER